MNWRKSSHHTRDIRVDSLLKVHFIARSDQPDQAGSCKASRTKVRSAWKVGSSGAALVSSLKSA